MGQRDGHEITRMNHVAIAVPDLDAAAALYRDVLGCPVSDPQTSEEQGVTIVYVTLGNVNIELMSPHGDSSPIAKFLERNPAGGLHHVGVEVSDMDAAIDHLKAHKIRVLGDGTAANGIHGNPILFLHPKDLCGTLLELEQT